MIPPIYLLILSSTIFLIGCFGFLIRRDTIVSFMCIEIMLNSANLAFLTFGYSNNSIDGVMVVFFVILVAAAESAVGLSIILLFYKHKRTVDKTQANLLHSGTLSYKD